MFTGIVTEIGRVRRVGESHGDLRFEIEAPRSAPGVEVGASIAHSGACLTAVELYPDGWAVEVSRETLSVTTLDAWREGAEINLERAMRAGDEFGGHVVSGHVDGVGVVESVTPEAGSHRLRIRAPEPLHRFIAHKGSIAVEGVSLTVNEVEGTVFGLNIIPHTWTHTTLGRLQPGDRVNLEIDMLARYAVRWLETAN